MDPITPDTSFLNAAEGWVMDAGTLTGLTGYTKVAVVMLRRWWVMKIGNFSGNS